MRCDIAAELYDDGAESAILSHSRNYKLFASIARFTWNSNNKKRVQ